MTDLDVGTARDELVTALQTTVEELQTAQEELSRQNQELALLQSALAADARRMQLLFDAAPIAFLTTDRRGIVTEANLAASALLEIPRQFLPGKPLAAFVDVTRRRDFRAAMLAIHPRERINVPMRMRRRNGVAFEALASAISIEDEIMWTIADQTLLSQAEEQVWQLNRELEERVGDRTTELETLIEHLPVGVAVFGPDGAVVRLNHRAQEISGHVETSLERLFPEGALTVDGEGLEAADYPAERARQGESVRDVRLVTKRADGSPVTVQATAVPLGDRGGVVVVFDDVSEHSRRERAEREFISNAAHQIRTPITSIASVVAALQAGGRDDPAALDRFIAHIEAAVTRLAGLAEALLTLARIQRGAARPTEIVPVRPLLEEIVDGRDVAIEDGEHLAIVADRKLLVEALSNLVDNAFVHGGGRVEISAAENGTRTLIAVRDHGRGIPKAERTHAVERFGTSGRGAGLGLAIANEAAEAIGGSLTLDDAPGGGLLVVLDLPGATLL